MRNLGDYALGHRPPPAPEESGSSGARIAEVTLGDVLVRTQQIMTKAALNPSNVLGYDMVHQIDPDTDACFFEGDFADFLNEAAKFYLLKAYGVAPSYRPGSIQCDEALPASRWWRHPQSEQGGDEGVLRACN